MNDQERELDLMVAELEQENRLLRARNDRLEAEQHLQALHDENVRLGLYEQPTVNQFNPDYDGVAMMYEEMKVMAKRIEELERPSPQSKKR
jgi:predicted xylose isomerase-like sugar epimerase